MGLLRCSELVQDICDGRCANLVDGDADELSIGVVDGPMARRLGILGECVHGCYPSQPAFSKAASAASDGS